jgi:hypothetical protein
VSKTGYRNREASDLKVDGCTLYAIHTGAVFRHCELAVKRGKIEENRGALKREVPECDGRIRGGKGRGIGNVQLDL